MDMNACMSEKGMLYGLNNKKSNKTENQVITHTKFVMVHFQCEKYIQFKPLQSFEYKKISHLTYSKFGF